MWLRLSLLLAIAPSILAQEPESPTIESAQKSVAANRSKEFPTDWIGCWRGEVTSQSASGTTQAFQMELTIAPTEKSDRFQWNIIYDGAQGKSERRYFLVVKDAARGRYVIDENNGIELDAIRIGDSLIEHFSVGGQRIWSSTKLVKTTKGREIHFELFSADENQSSKSGGQNGTPEVTSLRVGSRQTAVLMPSEKNSNSESNSSPTQFVWKKLTTEAYRGKQDDIYFVSDKIGWYVNGAGKIFKTVDGGETWSMKLHKPGTFFRCIAFIDEQHGFAGNIGPDYFPNVSDKVPLYETTDGGDTWSAVANIDGAPVVGLCAMQIIKEQFINAGTLDTRVRIVGVGRVGGPVAFIYSDDLGKTWHQQNIADKAEMALDVFFFNRNEGFIAAATSADTPKTNALILSTSDGGKTWNKAWQSTRPFELTWKMSFPTREVGYVTIQSYNPDPKVIERFVAKTTDGGKNWSEIPLVSDAKVREFGIGFLDENTGWVGAVPNGFQTTDGGKSWVPVAMGTAVNKIRLIETEHGHIGYAIGVEVHRMEVPKK